MVRVKQYYYNLLLLQSWFPYDNVMLESFTEPFFSDGTDCHNDNILWKTGFIAQPTQPGQKKGFTTKSDSFAVIVN